MITGRAFPVGPVAADADWEMFTADISEVVITKLNGRRTNWSMSHGRLSEDFQRSNGIKATPKRSIGQYLEGASHRVPTSPKQRRGVTPTLWTAT